jgi:hypothetical protein
VWNHESCHVDALCLERMLTHPASWEWWGVWRIQDKTCAIVWKSRVNFCFRIVPKPKKSTFGRVSLRVSPEIFHSDQLWCIRNPRVSESSRWRTPSAFTQVSNLCFHFFFSSRIWNLWFRLVLSSVVRFAFTSSDIEVSTLNYQGYENGLRRELIRRHFIPILIGYRSNHVHPSPPTNGRITDLYWFSPHAMHGPPSGRTFWLSKTAQ